MEPEQTPSEHSQPAPIIDLSVLEPHEVLALYTRSEQEGDSGALEDVVSMAIQRLPVTNPEHAVHVYAAFVCSPDEQDREHAGYFIRHLARQDREHGVRLWRLLLYDPVPAVRLNAYEPISRCFDPITGEPIDDEQANLGISWRDVAQLANTYRQAEIERNNNYRLGEAALVKTLVGDKTQKPIQNQD